MSNCAGAWSHHALTNGRLRHKRVTYLLHARHLGITRSQMIAHDIAPGSHIGITKKRGSGDPRYTTPA